MFKSLNVGGGEKFEVKRIFCVGRNYEAHAREMGHDPNREPPFFFLKPYTALVPGNSVVLTIPNFTQELHHEIELVVAIGGEGKRLSAKEASSLIFGYAVGLDITARDLQTQAKKLGRPWDVSKGFDGSAPCSDLVKSDELGADFCPAITLRKNGELVQQGVASQMIWTIPELICELSQYYCLQPGDLIFTGTPAGVGKMTAGDLFEAEISGLPRMTVELT
jgi:fumarylpyruvate hydrolase